MKIAFAGGIGCLRIIDSKSDSIKFTDRLTDDDLTDGLSAQVCASGVWSRGVGPESAIAHLWLMIS